MPAPLRFLPLLPAPRRPLAALALASALAGALPASAIAASLAVQVRGADGRPLADAVVYLDSAAAKAALKAPAPAEIAQKDKQFAPRITVVHVGAAVSFPNQDTVRHHVYSFSPAKSFELKLYAGTPAAPVVFDKPGIAVLGCNIHDRMAAWVLVLETPYHARTGADGVARLDGVPAGAYRLRTWHETLPPETAPADQALTLADGTARAEVRLDAGAR